MCKSIFTSLTHRSGRLSQQSAIGNPFHSNQITCPLFRIKLNQIQFMCGNCFTVHRAASNELSVVLLFLSRSFSSFQPRVYLAFDVRNSQLAFEISHELNVVFYCTIIKSRNVMGHRNKANHPLLPFVAELNQ